MLPCVCSVIDHRWRQNVVRTKSGTRGVAECVTDVLTTFWRLLWSITESDARQLGIYLFYIITKAFFISKYFNISRKPAFCPAFALPLHEKKAIWRDLFFQNEGISLVAMRSKELWLVEKNRATVKPDSSAAPRWMKTYSESRIELRNLQILKKLLEKSSQFCHRSSPVSRKAWTLPWKLQELKKYPRKTCGCGQPRGHLIRVLIERSVNDVGDFCLLWLVSLIWCRRHILAAILTVSCG